MRLEAHGRRQGFPEGRGCHRSVRLSPEAALDQADFIHGEVLVMPDGHMRHFGPYGKLENCIRPADSAQMWVSFLQADALAMPAWCDSHRYVRVASVAPAGMVAAIDRQLGNPCR